MADDSNDVVEVESTFLIAADTQEQYWTKDRIIDAINNPKPMGKTERPAYTPEPLTEQVDSSVTMDDTPPEEASLFTPQPDTKKVEEKDYGTLPYSACGKLLFKWKGKNWSGTAWTIAGSAIFTAGHNVYDKGEASTNLVFIPQYRNGTEPCGQFPVKEIYTLKGWTEKTDYNYDLASCITTKPIQKITGALGWIANKQADLGPYLAIGYPGKKIPGYDFAGKAMWQCLGPYFEGKKDEYIAAYNNLSQGASGGPWRVVVDGKSYVNGITSHDKGNVDITYSPYFGQGFLNLYEKVKDLT